MRPQKSYVWFVVLQDFGLSLTFTSYVPYLRTLGLDPSDVSLVNFGFWAAMLICELPTGIFADRYGRVRSVRVGVSIAAISALLYSTATGLFTAALYEMLIGVGMSFISGALGAWIRDAMHAHAEEDYGRTIARAAQYRSLASLVGGVTGGLIGLENKRFTWFASGSVLLLVTFIAFTHMQEERAPVIEQTTDEKKKNHPLRKSWKLLRERSDLKWIILAYLSFGLVLPFNHYWTPFFNARVGSLGTTLLWIPMNLSLAISAYFVRRIGVKQEHESRAVCFSLLVMGLGLALMSQFQPNTLSIMSLVIHELGRGMFLPLLETFTQRRIERDYRATYGSLQSLLARLGNLGVLATVWLYSADLPWDNALIGRIWTTAGVVLMLTTILLWQRKP